MGENDMSSNPMIYSGEEIFLFAEAKIKIQVYLIINLMEVFINKLQLPTKNNLIM